MYSQHYPPDLFIGPRSSTSGSSFPSEPPPPEHTAANFEQLTATGGPATIPRQSAANSGWLTAIPGPAAVIHELLASVPRQPAAIQGQLASIPWHPGAAAAIPWQPAAITGPATAIPVPVYATPEFRGSTSRGEWHLQASTSGSLEQGFHVENNFPPELCESTSGGEHRISLLGEINNSGENSSCEPPAHEFCFLEFSDEFSTENSPLGEFSSSESKGSNSDSENLSHFDTDGILSGEDEDFQFQTRLENLEFITTYDSFIK
jgi:hypothetical protein